MHSLTFPSFNHARQVLARKLTEVDAVRKGEVAPPPPRKTYENLREHWKATKGAAKRRPQDDTSIFRCHLDPAFGGLTLTEITYERIEAFKAARAHLAPGTVRHHLNLLGAMLKHARRLGWLRPDQVPAIDRPSIRVNGQDFCYLRSTEEIRRFLRAARDEGLDAFTMYATAIYTGLRQGELAALVWDRIDLDKRLITVDRSFNGPTKASDVRYVPIVDALLPVLRDWRLRCPGPLVFPNVHGAMHRPADRIFAERFHRVLDAAGFPRPTKGKQLHYIRFHDLRHTFASHWMMGSGDLFKLQKVLGHKSTELTLRYAHLSPAAFAADYGRFNALDLGDDAEVLPWPRPMRRSAS